MTYLVVGGGQEEEEEEEEEVGGPWSVIIEGRERLAISVNINTASKAQHPSVICHPLTCHLPHERVPLFVSGEDTQTLLFFFVFLAFAALSSC